MRALVTGATGFVGHRLLTRLESPVVLSRNAQRAEKDLAEHNVKAFAWNTSKQPPAAALENIDTVFHLAGEPVAEGRWTAEKKRRLRDSRELGTRNLSTALAALDNKPRVLVAASAVGYYGDRGEEVLTESAPPADDFLAEICQVWEKETQPARDAGIRVVNVRIGIVLGAGGGALAKMLTPFKLGVGGRLGSGKQWMPWIHLDDLVALMLFAATNESVSGPLNGAAPNPVTNYEFTKTMGRVLGRPTIFPAPGFLLRIALGEFAQVLLASQRVVPQAALDAGFEFQYPDLAPALRAILGN